MSILRQKNLIFFRAKVGVKSTISKEKLNLFSFPPESTILAFFPGQVPPKVPYISTIK